MDNFAVLHKIGLTKKEAALYTALLEQGTLSITDLSKFTHINRPAIYEQLPKLIERGIVSKVQKQKRVLFQAESPERLLQLYKNEQKETEESVERLVSTYKKATDTQPMIKYFSGKNGIKFVFDDIAFSLPKGSTFYRYTARTGEDTKEFSNTYYSQTRDNKHLERLVITSEKKAATKVKKLDRFVKAIPKEFDLFEDNISLVIYGNKTAYIDYNSNTAFIVESEKIAHFQEKLFRLLYKKL